MTNKLTNEQRSLHAPIGRITIDRDGITLLADGARVGKIISAQRQVGGYQMHGWEVQTTNGAPVFWAIHWGDCMAVGLFNLRQHLEGKAA